MLFHDPRFWLAISFLLFLILIIRYALPLILKMIDDKGKQISQTLQEAEDLRKQAEKLLNDAEKYHEDSIKYSQKLIEDANMESEKIINDSKITIANEINKKIAAAEERIKTSEERVVREIKTKIIKSAIGAIESNVDKIVDDKAMDLALKNSINQISSKLVN